MADARAATGERPPSPATTAPRTYLPSWSGEFQSNVTPPDPTGAAGPTRYIELVNLRYGIYDRINCLSGACSLLGDGDLEFLFNDFHLSDPQILWDPATQRFYLTLVDYISDVIVWAFSKTDSPSSAGDFCTYTADFGYGATSTLPDYPKLGDTQNFLLVGVNLFANFSTYLGSDVDWIPKPSPGSITTCPAQGAVGKFSHVANATPVPAVQTDASSNGWVVSAPDVSGGNSATVINVFQVTDAGTSVSLNPTPVPVAVPTFTLPANARQCGTTKKLDTLDGRLEHAMSGMDGANMAVWTAHSVAGGAGSEERWYEIGVGSSPSSPTAGLLNSGRASSSSLYVWNGAISSDRAVTPSASAYGSNWVMGFNTASGAACPTIQMISSSSSTSFTTIMSSPSYDQDFSCRKSGSTCRWGDYSGASPDPTVTTTSTIGAVWLSNEWNVANSNLERAAWRTWNWEATP
jgi:hypothetical protein